MNSPVPPTLTRPKPRRWWLWIVVVAALIPFVGITALGLGVVSYLHQSSDTRALRKELTRASGADWQQRIGLNIGSLTLCAARAGLSFVPMEDEARAALRTVRGVEVGIYEVASASQRPDCSAMLTAADGVMKARGWERVVGVMDGRQLVGVYLPTDVHSVRRMKACVVVMEGHQMVVVSARANLEPLMECLQKQHDWPAEVKALASW